MAQRIAASDYFAAHRLPGELEQPELEPLALDFLEEPVPLDVFCWDRRYLGEARVRLSDEQYAAVLHAERIYRSDAISLLSQSADPKIRAHWSQPVRQVNFMVLQWGKGSGKDMVCRVISLRIAYLLLCLRSPQAYYGMPGHDTIHLLNVAASSRQASEAFFAPMRATVSQPTCWFANRGVEVVEVKGPRGQRRQPSSQVTPLRDTIRFASHIDAISGHSDAESQEGLNLMLGIADEIDAFKRKDELRAHNPNAERDSTRSAEGIVKMLRTSGRSRFAEEFKNIYLSWPRYKGSMIQELTEHARKDMEEEGEQSQEWYSGPAATWDVNPRASQEKFAKDYKDDPVMARAMYECKPSRAISPFFTNEAAIEACLTSDQPGITGHSYFVDRNAWGVRHHFAAGFRPIQGALYSMHADLAVNSDSAGLAMCHVAKWEDYVGIGYDDRGLEIPLFERRPVVKVDFVLRYRASTGATPPREIQLRWARNLAFDLRRRGFAVRRFTYDGYQSTDSMQILLANGIESERVSTDLTIEPYLNLRDLFSEERIVMARPPEVEDEITVLDELFALNKLGNGKVDHPPGGSKDMADALAIAVQGAILIGGQEAEDGAIAILGSGRDPWSGPTTLEEQLPIGFTGSLASLRPGQVQRRHVTIGLGGSPSYGEWVDDENGVPVFVKAGMYGDEVGDEEPARQG